MLTSQARSSGGSPFTTVNLSHPIAQPVDVYMLRNPEHVLRNVMRETGAPDAFYDHHLRRAFERLEQEADVRVLSTL